MQTASDLVQSEQHDAEEPCLEEEGGQHFVSHQGPDDGACLVGEHAPIRPELVAHHQSGNDAHGEGDGEDLLPVVEESEERAAAGRQPQGFQYRQIAGQTDRESGKHDVEADRKGELPARQQDRVETIHCASFQRLGKF